MTASLLPAGLVNTPYKSGLSVAGGVAPYTWTASGSMPLGLTLSSSGDIAGTPTTSGTFKFFATVTDSATAAASQTVALSLTVVDNAAAPPRDAVIYLYDFIVFGGGAGWKIRSDGSLEFSALDKLNLYGFPVPSPSLPLIFGTNVNQQGGTDLVSLLINPDYSITPLSSTNITSTSSYPRVAVDPTGSNLYVLGSVIGSPSSPANTIPGILILTANPSPQIIRGIAIADVTSSSSLVFTPDGAIGFLSTCNTSSVSSVSVYSRASNGMLTAGPTYTLTSGCPSGLAVSPDGKYLATSEIQIYRIASDGSLTAVLPAPFLPTFGSYPGSCTSGIMWDSTGSYVICGSGSVAVMSFLGGSLTQTYYPQEQYYWVTLYPHQVGTFVYGSIQTIHPEFGGVVGYDLQNGQLVPVPGSPYFAVYASPPILIY